MSGESAKEGVRIEFHTAYTSHHSLSLSCQTGPRGVASEGSERHEMRGGGQRLSRLGWPLYDGAG